MNKKIRFNFILLIVWFLCINSLSMAQDGPPSPPNDGGGPASVNDVPIGMYWLVLLFAGAFYGIVKNK